jgi:5-methylcytosine-specific restriction endonuclease McrA
MCVWHARRANSGIDPESPAKIQGDPVMNGSGLRLCADCRNWCDADDFPQAYGHKHTCGPCLRAKRSDYALDRSTKIKSNFVEHVDRLTVYERDGWICQICMSPIDRELKFPARMSPSVDHIVPVSHGGDHSYENVRASHLTCNIKRGNRTRVA